MYRKDSEGWQKHADFIVLDMICLQLAYVLAYAISGYGFNPYATIIYRNMAVFLELADLVVIFGYGTMKSVLKRGYYRYFEPLHYGRRTGNLIPVFAAGGTAVFTTDPDSHHSHLSWTHLSGKGTLEEASQKADGRWRRTEAAHYYLKGCGREGSSEHAGK